MDKLSVDTDDRPFHKIFRKIFNFFASAKLALALLITILICCLAGVTFLQDAKAVELIFSTLWFNALLVMLVINIACCFSGRILGRRITVISFGMILFHISFVVIMLGVVYNSLFYFRGTIRLTEGETLPSGDINSYDKYERGRFFSFLRLRGETRLIKVHQGYRVGNEDKRAAYEIEVGEGGAKSSGVIYITHNLTHKGFSYYTDVEGYSLLVMLSDASGKDMYGAHIPLQSLKQKDGSLLYATGTKEGAGSFPFPQDPLQPFMGLQLSMVPSGKNDLSGVVFYSIYPLDGNELKSSDKPAVAGKVNVGESFSALNHGMSVKEMRYWITMTVRYEPGKSVVLASLCMCLVGLIITTAGRMLNKSI